MSEATEEEAFDEALRQMRVRRHIAYRVHAANAAAAREGGGEGGVRRTSSSRSIGSMSLQSFNSLHGHGRHRGDDDSVSQEDERAYWRRLSDSRKQAQQHQKQQQLEFGNSNSSTPSTPTSVMDVKDIIEREVIGKLQGALQNHPPENTRRSHVKFGKYEQQARELEFTIQDIHQLLDQKEFVRLQKSLRKKGAVTNELLKQVLPLVVKQSQQRTLKNQQALATITTTT